MIYVTYSHLNNNTNTILVNPSRLSFSEELLALNKERTLPVEGHDHPLPSSSLMTIPCK
jgi:hypothetical protein